MIPIVVIAGLGSPHDGAGSPPPTADELSLVAALVEGLTDEDAARRLGWTRRTLERRLRSGMDKLGATSRFQAGFLVAKAGWLDNP